MSKFTSNLSPERVAIHRGPLGTVVGTVFQSATDCCLVDPCPQLLSTIGASDQARMLDVETVYITTGSIELTRGLCALIAYSRVLGRTRPLTVVTTAVDPAALRVLRACCQVLLHDANFTVDVTSAAVMPPAVAGFARRAA